MPMRRRNESDEVVYLEGAMVVLDCGDIRELGDLAAKNPRGRMRFCTHTGVDDPVHEMFIVHERRAYVRPHKHLTKTESFHVISGSADVVLYEDDGRISEVVTLGDFGSGLPFYYRLSDPVYHTLRIRTGQLVFHETAPGPFDCSDSVFPDWAPGEDDRPGQEQFLRELGDCVDAFLAARGAHRDICDRGE